MEPAGFVSHTACNISFMNQLISLYLGLAERNLNPNEHLASKEVENS